MQPALGAALAVILLALGGADYWFVERPAMTEFVDQTGGSSSIASSATGVRKGTRRRRVINVIDILTNLEFSTSETSERGLLTSVVTDKEAVKNMVLLKNNDRAALLSWVETEESDDIFLELKERLSGLFSADLQDLRDETIEQETGPIYDILSFQDPAIAPEKIVMLRVRERLYEIHVAEGQEQAVEELIVEFVR